MTLNTFLKTAIFAVGRQFVSTALSGVPEMETEHHGFGFGYQSGLDGSRTRVRKPIPCPSTSVVYPLTFPLSPGAKHPGDFSSFMIRPHAQSFASVVSHIVEAGILKCECSRADCCN